MIFSVVRSILPNIGSSIRRSSRQYAIAATHAIDQMDFIKTEIEHITDWTTFKEQLLNKTGNVNSKNFEGVLLKILVHENKFDTALSFADHLRSSKNLSLGAINGLLLLYYELGLQNKLNDEGKAFILQSYKQLYEKYKILDSSTCERLLHALCVIKDWKKAVRVLDDIYVSNKPTHSAFSMIISTFFELNKKTEAMKYIKKSIESNRPITTFVYQHWVDYILRKYKDKKTIIKYLDEMLVHISSNGVVVTEETAEMLRETYSSLGWNANHTKIRKSNGQCFSCKQHLDNLKLSEDEFSQLQKNVKDKLIVGSDLLLKSSPGEFKKFLDFVEETAPYDVVLDALNIALALSKNYPVDKVKVLMTVVEHFREQNKRILLLGRKHMLGWPRIRHVLSKTCHFFTENLSQDDPYFITAAILSGPTTDIVSKDLLRGHRFNLQDQQLQSIFQRWQWQHQWMVYVKMNGSIMIQPPLPVTPCAQKRGASWHLPSEGTRVAGRVRDGVPDWNSWLCLTP